MQVQAVDASMLKHLDGLNIEGVLRSVHMWGNTQGVVRVSQHGGDLLYFRDVPTGTLRVWKVVKVVETWADWCHVIVNMQTDAAPPSAPPP
jgi:CMP-2-keto-3-deoxyoctulosonic acid synthetase